MSTKTETRTNKNGFGAKVVQFSKDYMSIVGILLLIVIFSTISYIKFGAQYFFTLQNWKNILLQSSTVAIVALGQSIILLTRVSQVFEIYCVKDITANEEMCRKNLMNSTAMATALCPRIGYEAATKIVKRALHENISVLDVAAEELQKPKTEIELIFEQCLREC